MEEYDLQKAILKEAAKPASEKAVFSIEKPVAEYAADRAAADTRTTINAQELAQHEKQFLTRLIFARNQLADFSRNNDLATLIAAGGIPVQLAANQQMKNSMDKQSAMTQELIGMEKNKVKIANDATAALSQKMSDYLDMIEKMKKPTKPIPVPEKASLADSILNYNKQGPYVFKR